MNRSPSLSVKIQIVGRNYTKKSGDQIPCSRWSNSFWPFFFHFQGQKKCKGLEPQIFQRLWLHQDICQILMRWEQPLLSTYLFSDRICALVLIGNMKLKLKRDRDNFNSYSCIKPSWPLVSLQLFYHPSVKLWFDKNDHQSLWRMVEKWGWIFLLIWQKSFKRKEVYF